MSYRDYETILKRKRPDYERETGRRERRILQVPNTWELTSEQKIDAAKAAKERGTHFLKEGKLRLALNKYKRVEDLLEYEKSTTGEQKEVRVWW